MRRPHGSVSNGRCERSIGAEVLLGVRQLRNLSTDAVCVSALRHHVGKFGRAEFLMGGPDQVDSVASGFEVARGGFSNIGVVAEEGEQQRGWDGDFVRARAVIVLHGILSTDARQSIGSTNAFQFSICSNELSEFEASVRCLFRLDGVRPAEVVKAGHLVHVQPHAHRIANRFIDGGGGHGARVDVGVPRRNTARNHETVGVPVNGGDDAGIPWTVAFDADKGFDGRLGNDFVVVLANPSFLAGDVWSLQHPFQESGVVGGGRRNKRRQLGRTPFRFEFELWDAVVEEFNGQIRHGGVVIANVKHAR